jgi:eukaryotic-like serine/threonine-protein kinase
MADEAQRLAAGEQDRLLDTFETLWQRGEIPRIRDFLPANDRPDYDGAANNRSDSTALRAFLLELVMLDLWHRWRQADNSPDQAGLNRTVLQAFSPDAVDRFPFRPTLEDYVRAFPEIGALQDLPLELIAEEFRVRLRWGDDVPETEYLARFPAHAQELAARLSAVRNEVRTANPPDAPTVAFHSQGTPIASFTSAEAAAPLPRHIGRYRIEKILGKGSFGLVYLAYDDQLERFVAIKVPHGSLVSRPEDAQAYLTEARTVANLDHPNIVPVYDIGNSEQFPCFVVSKYIDGTALSKRMKHSRYSVREAAELTATVAGALHHAHKQGFVHRDVKPGNILLDKNGAPYVADFGLALREQDVGRGPCYAGTLQYMSPEQAHGEGNRVDGRSDIFSLGVVLYELLVGHRPFKGDSEAELIEQITSVEARPPRQIDEGIPKELDRICLKALSKRASERYSTALDMADDLHHFLAEVPPPVATPAAVTVTNGQGVKIVPKGLRSFDARDADFFLELLPGPRDRDGLPESIGFWKTRVEETDADKTFCVGLMCGPSGCGKSSLMKAGCLPRLGDNVIAVYIEATADETETRLLNGLRKRCPALPAGLGLKETLAALRQGQYLAAGKKALIVIDQFEQWLHAKKEEENSELLRALRQCDGSRVQCVVMVRDDFWMAVIRFMRGLEIRLVEGQNSAAVDLFDLEHARKVLAAFGRAFGKLPEKISETTKEQNDFLNQAVSALAQEGKVVSVRLALFAEMMKGKPWTPAALRAVGGIEGVGLTFLEETFSAATAPPEHRYHQKAARAALKILLPASGTAIKGSMRSYDELLEASGYGNRPKDFDGLIGILNNELRLITPTDPDGKELAGDSPAQLRAGGKYYQLTHDYLVHSIRDWLTRKQKETRRGRAELLLADRATVWTSCPENRQLPSLPQWLQIEFLTEKRHWTPPQRTMMRHATQYHASWGLAVAVLLALFGWGSYEGRGSLKAYDLRDRLLDANTNGVLSIVKDMSPYRRWLDPLLRDSRAQAERDHDDLKQLHTSLALLPVDSAQVKYLHARLLDAQPHEVAVIRDALAPHKEALQDDLWRVLESPPKGKESQRLRAAAALAAYDPENEKWANAQAAVGNALVAVPALHSSYWIEALRPVRQKLIPQLSIVYGSPDCGETERSLATDILADYAADKPQILADLLMNADEKQFAVIYPKFTAVGVAADIEKELSPAAKDEDKEKLAKRQANAAVVLLKMKQPDLLWPLLRQGPDPRVRSYLIQRLAPLGADAAVIVQRLRSEQDITIRRALLLALGGLAETSLSADLRKALRQSLEEMYRTESDPGLHAATEWVLRTWDGESALKEVNEKWAKDKEQRDRRLASIQQLLAKEKDKTPRQWYVNGQGQTMVVIPLPPPFLMGSPLTEAGRQVDERLHKVWIRRTFALAAKSVTVEQYRKFDPGYENKSPEFTRRGDLPAGGIDWYRAAKYCNWLSAEEGIPEEDRCYEVKGDGDQNIAPKANYLSRRGYRLPTEAEMEYAIRAEATTSRYFGETEELLPKYAWYMKNSREKTWPVGMLCPNDFGLFDMHGDVSTWCEESYRPYPSGEEVTEDKEDPALDKNLVRVVRGGSFDHNASGVRSAYRDYYSPTIGDVYFGLRVARTL